MKKTVISALIFGFAFVGCKKDEDDNQSNVISDPTIEIPDANFKAILVNNPEININNDNEISKSEASAFTGAINAANSEIIDVTGLAYFTNVSRISLFGNAITSIDISNNTKVTQLLLENNQLTAIDVSALPVLTDFKCHSNLLIRANVANGNNSYMTRMEVQGNPDLTCITVDNLDISFNGWIKDFEAGYSTNCN